MKKRRYLPALLICTALLLTACSGFNRLMRDHLSSMESYSRYPCTFTALSQEHDTCAFIVSLDEMPDDDLQYGCCYDEEYSAEICRLEMIAANYE